MARIGAHDLIDRVVDEGSFTSWDSAALPPFGLSGAPSAQYLEDLERARAKTGLDESILTGQALIGGRPVAIVLGDFAFLAGSIGVAAAERLVLAIERATAQRLPLIAGPTSGGTRMQEGTVAFIQMVKISAAIAAHKAAKLPYLVYLRDPTTGGVLASWGSLGHLTAAQPGALIGFLGPRVYEALYEDTFPTGVQTSENLFRHGLVDAVVSPELLRRIAITALQVLDAPRTGLPAVIDPPHEEIADVPAWDSIVRSRRPERPGLRALLRVAARDVTPLQGTGEGERDSTILLALARFGSAPCIVLGHDRRQEQGPMGPAGLREARRAMRLAVELGLPLVTVIDTAGAALSQAAEEGGLAGEIARCLAELTVLPAPTVCLLMGQGAGGGALALLPADRVICAEHGWLSPLPPEGASAIVHRSTEFAPQMAQEQGVRSVDLLRHGIVDRIVAEHPDAADEPTAFLRRMGAVLEFELTSLLSRPASDLLVSRLARYRSLGLEPA
jgi:acetyl-CoA carboxylase carboxyl transferase beta subunit